jgi:hypothetical protein
MMNVSHAPVPKTGARRCKCCSASLSVALLLAAIACGPGGLLGPEADQGVDGLVLLGPTCPVQSLEDPCPDRPYSAQIEILTAGAAHVTTTRSGEDGRFRVGLRPGRYLLRPEPGDPFPTAADQEVEVVEGVFTGVTILYDTGIR